MIEAFLGDLDNQWKAQGSEPITLKIIGCTALLLQCSYDRGTKDSDIIEIAEISSSIKKQLEELAGIGTSIALKHRMYVDLVKRGILFLPQTPNYHPHEIQLNNFKIETLDIVDVVISKLFPFRAQDIEDIKGVIDLGYVKNDLLEERFRSAVEVWLLGDARVNRLKGIVENLNRVQRDFLLAPETVIELPDWTNH